MKTQREGSVVEELEYMTRIRVSLNRETTAVNSIGLMYCSGRTGVF